MPMPTLPAFVEDTPDALHRMRQNERQAIIREALDTLAAYKRGITLWVECVGELCELGYSEAAATRLADTIRPRYGAWRETVAFMCRLSSTGRLPFDLSLRGALDQARYDYGYLTAAQRAA